MPYESILNTLIALYVIAAIGVWHGLHVRVAPGRLGRTRRELVLPVVGGLAWPGTVLVGLISDTETGLAWLRRIAGVTTRG